MIDYDTLYELHLQGLEISDIESGRTIKPYCCQEGFEVCESYRSSGEVFSTFEAALEYIQKEH